MSVAGNIIRRRNETGKAINEAFSLLSKINDLIGASSVKELADCFLLVDHCLTHCMYLKAIDTYIREGGRSRGSYIITEKEGASLSDKPSPYLNIELCNYDREIEKNILEVKFDKGNAITNLAEVREIPQQNLWFEKVWKEYLEDNFADG
jgi:hypothetical protein